MVYLGFLILLSIRKNSWCQWCTWLIAGVPCSLQYLIHPCNLIDHIPCLLFLVMNYSWYMKFDRSHTVFYIFGYECLMRYISDPMLLWYLFCNLFGILFIVPCFDIIPLYSVVVALKFISVFTPVIFQPGLDDKYGCSYWWGHVWSRILGIPLIRPLTKSHIIYLCIRMYSINPGCLWSWNVIYVDWDNCSPELFYYL